MNKKALILASWILMWAASTAHAQIALRQLSFNWGEGSQAITLYDPCTDTPIQTPEYDARTSQNLPAAYVHGTTVSVEVVLHSDSRITQALIRADGTFGGIAPRTITFQTNGDTLPERLEAVAPIPDRIQVTAVHWEWRYSLNGGFTWTSIGATDHQIYALNRRPLVSRVYQQLAQWTTEWCTGLPDEPKLLADAILEGFVSSGKIKYGEDGWDTAELLCTGDGMCGGMKELFHDALRTQGYTTERTCLILKDADPGEQRLWEAIITQSPGLGQSEPTFWPRKYHWIDETYPLPTYGGEHALNDDVEPEVTRAYIFFAPLDGHCVNLLEDQGIVYLYDLSFGTGPWAGVFDGLPQTGYYQDVELAPTRENYINEAFDHMEGKIYYEDPVTGEVGLGDRLDVRTELIPITKIEDHPQMRFMVEVLPNESRSDEDSNQSTSEARPIVPRPGDVADSTHPDAGTALPAWLRALIEEEHTAVDWTVLKDRILKVERTPAVEGGLESLLWRRQPLVLFQETPIPGVMPPLEMLQAAVLTRFAEWKSPTARAAIEALEQNTSFELLRATAEKTLLRIQ